jgi:hypothetical protein
MTTQPLPMPEWPAGERWVISYSDARGHVHATRHAGGCAVLRTVRNAMDHDPARLNPEYHDHRVLEEERYDRQVELGNLPPYKDHICVKGTEAPTPSFRHAMSPLSRPGGLLRTPLSLPKGPSKEGEE